MIFIVLARPLRLRPGARGASAGRLRVPGAFACSSQGALQHAPDDLSRIEMLFRERAREPALSLVVAGDRLERAHRLVLRAEAKESACVGQEPARARVLDDGRLPAGQVAERPVADPCVLQAPAGRLGATELAARTLDVALVVPRGRGDCMRVVK